MPPSPFTKVKWRNVLINHRLIGRDRHQGSTQQTQPIADFPNGHGEGG